MASKKVGAKIDMDRLRNKYLPIDESKFQSLPLICREAIVFKLLRSMVSFCAIAPRGEEYKLWSEAKVNREARQFADEMGWTLSGDVPRLVRSSLAPSVDFVDFQECWQRAVGEYQLIDAEDDWLAQVARYANSASNRGIWNKEAP